MFDCGFNRHLKFCLTLRSPSLHAQGVLYKTGPPSVSRSFSTKVIRGNDEVVVRMVVRLTMTQLTDLGVCAKCAHEETQNLKTNQSRTPSPRYTLARGGRSTLICFEVLSFF